MKKYRITFKEQVDLGVSITDDIIIKEEFLKSQITILIDSGYTILKVIIIGE